MREKEVGGDDGGGADGSAARGEAAHRGGQGPLGDEEGARGVKEEPFGDVEPGGVAGGGAGHRIDAGDPPGAEGAHVVEGRREHGARSVDGEVGHVAELARDEGARAGAAVDASDRAAALLADETVQKKPEHIRPQIVEGQLKKWQAEVCLLEQPFIKNPDVTIADLVKSKISELGENIVIRRFTRYMVGEGVVDEPAAE